MHGEGKLTLPNNKTYKGKFENNKMSGAGTFKWGQTVEYKGNGERIIGLFIELTI